ncbi:MAG TPA: thiol:disulfide interchange protein DsbA/DsbL [Rhodocyclaceae bacterium]|nr:thiol:disulfide interchange protein DsbA/DsbL [Rhodocyclaceae bacterium]
MGKLAVFMTAVLLAVSGLASAAGLQEGKDYAVLKPARPVESRDKIEVTEFFWYGCPHCYKLDPTLTQWEKKLPKDVSFRRMPAVFPDEKGRPGRWAPLAQVYFSLEAMGLLDKLHSQVFDAIHRDRVNLNDPKVLLDWMASKGVDRQKFTDVMNSFTTQSKVLRAEQLSQSYAFDGVPIIYVDGRYTPITAEAEDPAKLVAIVDQLIDKVRKERAKH